MLGVVLGGKVTADAEELATDDADPGTIRGDLAAAMPNNLIHGSDSPESAQREIALWFADDELV